MNQRKKDRCELSALDDVVPRPKPDPDWKELAERLWKELDDTKLLELSHRLLDALDQRPNRIRYSHR